MGTVVYKAGMEVLEKMYRERLLTATQRVGAWCRDFGHLKNDEFVEDLELLSEVVAEWLIEMEKDSGNGNVEADQSTSPVAGVSEDHQRASDPPRTT